MTNTTFLKFAYKEDCDILADYNGWEGKTVVNCDGELVFQVDNSFSDNQIWRILELMNYAYKKGADYGRTTMRTDIKSLLDI